MEEAHFEKNQELENALNKRATGLYLRCMNYGLMLLDSGFEKALYGDSAEFEKRVSEMDKDTVDGLIWTPSAWPRRST